MDGIEATRRLAGHDATDPVTQGRTNNEIASELHITPSTVKAHRASLMRKLGARNRVEVAMWAHETGRV